MATKSGAVDKLHAEVLAEVKAGIKAWEKGNNVGASKPTMSPAFVEKLVGQSIARHDVIGAFTEEIVASL